MTDDLVALARKYYQSYAEKDRTGIEAIIDDEFCFTSPWDNKINRTTYFDRCWPNSETITGFDLINLIIDGERAFITYEGQSLNGKPFRNSEIMTFRNGKIIDIEVYFGWLIPHDAPAGGFVDPHTSSQPASHPEDQADGLDGWVWRATLDEDGHYVLYGRPLRCKGEFDVLVFPGRVQSCIRPIDAVQLTAGPDEVRGSAPHQRYALAAQDIVRVFPIPGSTGIAITSTLWPYESTRHMR
jgi:hypothetical protein